MPATYARIGLMDGLFSRVGASDNLREATSTFMAEMKETAYIMNHATPRSFVILDEVGRGTSVEEGRAIASSCLSYMSGTINCRTFFATHYLDLEQDVRSLNCTHCLTLKVIKTDSDIVFLHQVIEGWATTTYALDVAKMAGLPAKLLDHARFLLSRTAAKTA